MGIQKDKTFSNMVIGYQQDILISGKNEFLLMDNLQVDHYWNN